MKNVLIIWIFFFLKWLVIGVSGIKSKFDIVDTRIISGSPAKPGQFPWQAAIFHTRNNRSALCGGSLIHSEWILTAAHCVYRVHSFLIRIGTTISLGPGESSMQIFEPKAILLHENFDLKTFFNDIAVLKLERPAIINAFVHPIQVADPEKDILRIGDNVTVSGWGKVTEDGNVVTNLNYVNLKVISNADCQPYFDLLLSPTSFCCIGPKKENTCSGDSGGPLVKYDSNGIPKQVGIVSFGTNKNEFETLCTIGFPTGYTRVAAFKAWIFKNIRSF